LRSDNKGASKISDALSQSGRQERREEAAANRNIIGRRLLLRSETTGFVTPARALYQWPSLQKPELPEKGINMQQSLLK
jgi:hypothetical protein